MSEKTEILLDNLNIWLRERYMSFNGGNLDKPVSSDTKLEIVLVPEDQGEEMYFAVALFDRKENEGFIVDPRCDDPLFKDPTHKEQEHEL